MSDDFERPVYDSLDPIYRMLLKERNPEAADMDTERPAPQRLRARALLDMPLQDAARAKWDEGRRNYGGGEWVGDEPIVEAFPESLDQIGYIKEQMRRRPDRAVPLRKLLNQAIDLALEIRREARQP